MYCADLFLPMLKYPFKTGFGRFLDSFDLFNVSKLKSGHLKKPCICPLFIYSGKWAGGRKKHITLTRRKKTIPESDRQVSGQPLMFSKSVFNLRKLSEMPFHLIHSRQTALLENEVMFNFEWIHGKIQGQSLNDVIEDFALALEVRPEQDVR